ncbi:MAG TPA: pilus assembly protein TadG-related protein, partial [Candidatus Acidoferrales bacterium]|nr:pilus assembly protein TadG-related protein [Candidatus Acidoferrales bacterium]
MTVGICTGERQHREPRRWRGEPEAGERGATLFLMIVSLVVLLGVSAFAIDLGLHYVVRSEAQRAADAGALAGAKTFVDSGYLSGAITQSEAEDLARQTAITVASQNLVGGQ